MAGQRGRCRPSRPASPPRSGRSKPSTCSARAAAIGLARPAHAAGGDPGGRLRSPRRRRLRRAGATGSARSRRRRGRTARSARPEPAVDEPHRGGCRCSPQRQAVPIDELLDDRVRRLAQLLRDDDGHRRRRADLPLVSADYTMVEQVVTNLLENASRGTRRPGAEIVVERPARAATSSRSRSPIRAPGSTPPTSSGCSGPSSAAREPIDRARAGDLPRDRRGPRRHDHRRVGERRPRTSSGARFTFTLPVHRG